MLEIENCCIVVVDVQGRLSELMFEKDALIKNIQILIKAAKILDIPIIWCQQQPKALGATIPQISNLLTDIKPVDKTSFSCFGCEEFKKRVRQINRKQFLLCGIEAHVCIYQTAMDLLAEGKEVQLITDAVSSRTEGNKKVAIKRMAAEGVKISSTEMAVFELLRTAEHPQFKQVAMLVK
jgi:nicotinamidase-related amidase